MTGDADTAEAACNAPGSHRVVTGITAGEGHWDKCGVCFAEADLQRCLDDEGELCVSGEGTIHRTRRVAGRVAQRQEGYQSDRDAVVALRKMDVDEFDAHVADLRRGRSP